MKRLLNYLELKEKGRQMSRNSKERKTIHMRMERANVW